MLIFGVGVGLFVLILTWVVALLACYVSSQLKRNVDLPVVAVACSLTLILFIIPKEEYKDDTVEVYDTLYVWRALLVLFLVTVAFATSCVCLITVCTEQRFILRIRD